MNDTQASVRESNGSASRNMTSNKSVEKGPENNNRSNGPRQSTPQKATSAGNGDSTGKTSSKKRRKVNHGHLCHDEPREPTKKSKSEPGTRSGENEPSSVEPSPAEPSLNPLDVNRQDAGLDLGQVSHSRVANTTALVQPTPVAAPHHTSLTGNDQSLLPFQDWSLNSQSSMMQDMHFHPNYTTFNTSEVSNEYNLLNDFLSHSLMEDGGMYSNDDAYTGDPTLTNTMQTLSGSNALFQAPPQTNQMPPPSQAAIGNAISRPASGFPIDKARETYYMTAADPAGTDTPEERMKKLMKAKYDAGMLKPFNYVKGYARLQQFMDRNLQPQSRSRILRQLDRFRPKFRERMHNLSDMQLVMAIPACCWRRTGEIYRGNKEMAALIGVPIEHLRDGRIAIHEIFSEQSLVGYWEKFGAIAFDHLQKAILTSCSLKTREPNSAEPEKKCCFSFTIRRDKHNVPILIVGNFLPVLPLEK
ncbi:Replication factor C subunit 1 [Venturia nashicola]|uniref:Replication factor C subunit 1 n=1 Tax=Venturia nashicola TaxID=86259 RepID=A0A4Z1P8W9_9PEZI|nr:Replication factor C subunit 1 [Venturia nashicola]TLD36878.1 Replication factor C subunit 1 [Venturia nashicola]